MNEVKNVTAGLTPLNRTTSSDSKQVGDNGDIKLPVTGKDLPVVDTKEAAKGHVVGKVSTVQEENIREDTGQIVEKVNQFVQSVQRDLHFSVDEDSGLTVIRVRDKESGELIRQIPEDVFLNMAQNLKESNTIQLLDTHG